MFDRYAKDKYEVASSLIDEINGEDIRTLLLRITIELSTKRNADQISEETREFTELARLAEALLYRLIFDRSLKVEQVEAAALVCAYAYEILSPNFKHDSQNLFDSLSFLNRIISGLLYHIAGYDSNAKGVINALKEELEKKNENRLEQKVMSQFCRFTMLEMKKAIMKETNINLPKNIRGRDLEEYVRKACILELSACLNLIASEYLFVHENWNSIIENKLEYLYENSMQSNQQTVALLTLLLKMFCERTRPRAISLLKNPQSCDSNVWNNHMEFYIEKGIYFIWPPHSKAFEEGLFEEKVSGIISIPTGTGKSLIAEHKIITKLKEDNIVIYLAPTLALCRQIVRSLKGIINVQKKFKSNIFLNDIDFDGLDYVDSDTAILVLTPEKCVSLIANNIELVQKCNLCIVDEFHNLYHGERGALLDLLLSRIASIAQPEFLVMSALIDDSKEIINWLTQLNGKNVSTLSMKWRPSRTLRGFVAHPKSEIDRVIREAEKTKKKSYISKVDTQILFCVEDVWEQNKKTAYDIKLPIKMSVRLKYEPDYTGVKRWHLIGYGNDMARQIGSYLSKEMSVIIFSQGTRHIINEIKNQEKLHKNPQKVSDISKAYLIIAKIELGFESELKHGLMNGIGIHTQALIQEEQEAVEYFFKDADRALLCATGTLSQGLNLAASAVVVNTTRQYTEEGGKSLKKAEVINMIGRAGRPGLGQQSLGIIVPQYAATITNKGFSLDQESISYLERVDGSEKTSSGLLEIFTEIANKELVGDALDDNFALILNILGESKPKLRKDLISKTMATQFLEEGQLDLISDEINEWHDNFIGEQKELILQAATKSTNKVSTIQTLINNLDESELKKLLESTPQIDIIDSFFYCIEKFDEGFIKQNVDETFTNSKVLVEYLKAWIRGDSFLELAKILHRNGIGTFNEDNLNRSSRSSIAKAIKASKEGVRNISHIALGYIALIELILNQEGEVPETLQLLSPYIKYGVNNPFALKFRMLGLPRQTAIHLASTISNNINITVLVRKWKKEKHIQGLDAELSSAIIKILE